MTAKVNRCEPRSGHRFRLRTLVGTL